MNETKFFYWLDPIRAVAAILVLLSHACYVMFGYYPELEPSSQGPMALIFFTLCTQGITAVMFFFILSGFLVGGRNLEKLRHGTISVKKYIIDRFFRISVPLFGAILLIILTNAYLGVNNNWLSLAGQFAGLQGIVVNDEGGVFWTLAYEIWFYVGLLGILLICGKHHHVAGFAVLAIAMAVFGTLGNLWLLVICSGIAAYYLKDKIKLKKRALTVLLIATLIAMALFQLSRMTHVAQYLGQVYATRLYMFATVLFATTSALLISQIVSLKPQSAICVTLSKAGTAFSKISYSLFLTHFQVLRIYDSQYDFIHTLNINTITSFALLCLSCIILAWIFWYLIERNTRRVQNLCMNLLHHLIP